MYFQAKTTLKNNHYHIYKHYINVKGNAYLSIVINIKISNKPRQDELKILQNR
jgi:hypothetical protein